MKTSCPVIKDLLPLYADDAASPATRALVEEHLKECPDCAEILKKLTEKKPPGNEKKRPGEILMDTSENLRAVSDLKTLKQEIRKKNVKTTVFAVTLAALIFITGCVFLVLSSIKETYTFQGTYTSCLGEKPAGLTLTVNPYRLKLFKRTQVLISLKDADQNELETQTYTVKGFFTKTAENGVLVNQITIFTTFEHRPSNAFSVHLFFTEDWTFYRLNSEEFQFTVYY